MPSPFEVALDNTGRINHFVPANHPDERIQPEDIHAYLDGGERVSLKDTEYDLTDNGSLVHPDVEVIEPVRLGHGVRLDEGTAFRRELDGLESVRDWIEIGSHTRIKGTEIQNGVILGEHNFIRARFIGRNTVTGPYVRIGVDVEVGPDVRIDPAVKIDNLGQLSSGVHIGENTKLGFNTRVGKHADVGANSRIGIFTGAGPRGVNQDGPLILAGKVLPPSTHIRE